MKRKTYSLLLKWKQSETRKPLLLLGARQVGKTWIMKEFGRNEYDNVVYINCDEEPLMRELFKADYDIQRLLVAFQAISGQPISEGKTLIILDELQEAPRGLHSLKYFCENAPGLHVMAAGSLLGITLSQRESYPVGKVNVLKMYPMDFEEFLLAIGQKNLCAYLADDRNDAEVFRAKLTEYLRQYNFVGGMPEVVGDFARQTDLSRVRSLQASIVDAYRRDISKHSSTQESIRIGQVLGSLPSQLAKENKKFIYGLMKKGARAAEYETAIQWLVDAGLVYKIPKVRKVAMPLKFYEDISAFKLFLLDVGLLSCLADVPATSIVDGNADLKEYKGMAAEEYVAQQMVAAGFNLFYWSNETATSELDFVTQMDGFAVPIEVKAGSNVRGQSMSRLLKENPEIKGLRFSMLPHKEQDNLTNCPLWLLPFRFTSPS